jgi:hypothetical protein
MVIRGLYSKGLIAVNEKLYLMQICKCRTVVVENQRPSRFQPNVPLSEVCLVNMIS